MNKIPEGKFCKMYKVDGATIKTDTCEGIKEKGNVNFSVFS